MKNKIKIERAIKGLTQEELCHEKGQPATSNKNLETLWVKPSGYFSFILA